MVNKCTIVVPKNVPLWYLGRGRSAHSTMKVVDMLHQRGGSRPQRRYARVSNQMRLQFPTVHVKPGFAHGTVTLIEKNSGVVGWEYAAM